MGVACGSQILLCDLPVRFDNYAGCSHGCKYCFAQKKWSIEEGEQISTYKALESFISGNRKSEVKWCDWNIPIIGVE